MAVRNPNVGVAFPFGFGSDGRVRKVGGSATSTPSVDELDAAVRTGAHLVVSTGKSERVMLGQFGVGADRFLFSPLTHLLAGFLEADVREQISWFCGRASLREVVAQINPVEAEVVVALKLAHNALGDESILKVRVGASG